MPHHIREPLMATMVVLTSLSISACGGPGGEVVDLAADTDRDGTVDFRRDAAGEEEWTPERGAIFLANNDSDRRTGAPDNANDAIDGSVDREDLALLRLRIPRDVPEGARLQIEVDEASRERVRLFIEPVSDAHTVLGPSFPAVIDHGILQEEGGGWQTDLWIEARSFADGSWEGETLVTARLVGVGGEEIGADSVRLRVAPWIMLSNLHRGSQLYVRESPGRNDMFIEQLSEIVPAAGAELVLIPEDEFYTPGNIWVQDAMEIGYTEMPGHRMSVVLKANRDRALDEYPRREMLGPDFGWFQAGSYRPHLREDRSGNGWLDWYGNLDVSPPVPGYPMGRIYYGANGSESLNPEIVAMLDAQGIQGPAVRLDTGWFLIKHVDEMVCFVPTADEDRPHKVLVPSTAAMIDLLESWQGAGLGDVPLLQPFEEEATVSSLLDDEDLMAHNRALESERIAPNVEILKEAFSLEESDFIRIPALVSQRGTSVFPNMVNSVVLNGHFLVSDPHGPEPEGTDLLQEHVRGLLAELPLTVHFVDDRRYHRGSGNTHCATNVRRQGFDEPWWELLRGR